MPDKKTLERARKDASEGKSPSVQAGEFVKEEIHHIRAGQHGARSTKQAIAIGLSEARRAGVKLAAPKSKKTSPQVRRKAEKDLARAKSPAPRSRRRAAASERALKREPRTAASKEALSVHAHRAALQRTPSERAASSRKAIATKGTAGLSRAASKAARTRKKNQKT